MLFSFGDHFLHATVDSFGVTVLIDEPIDAKQPFACQLVYSQLGPWISIDPPILDSPLTFMEKQYRSCLNGSLGTPRGCIGAKERTFGYIWVRDRMNYSAAFDHCDKSWAKLFDYFYENRNTVEFMCQHMQPDNVFWVDLNDLEIEDVWVTSLNQSTNRFIADDVIRGTHAGQDFLAVDCNYRDTGDYADNGSSGYSSGSSTIDPISNEDYGTDNDDYIYSNSNKNYDYGTNDRSARFVEMFGNESLPFVCYVISEDAEFDQSEVP